MFDSAIAGSLPKAAWLAETEKLWPQWRFEGAELAQAGLDATLLWIKAQVDAGLDVIGDGEQSRQHFVRGFLERVEGIDFEHKVEMGIRADRYHGDRRKLAFAFAELLNHEARALQADGVAVSQFDEPAVNVDLDDAADWGVQALERAAQGLACKTALHIYYGYGIPAINAWKQSLGAEWRQDEKVFPALAASRIATPA